MKKSTSLINSILTLVFVLCIIYLCIRVYVIYSNKVVTYNNYKVITFNSFDEITIVTVLILAITIVLLPLFSKKKIEVIYVDKLAEEQLIININEAAANDDYKVSISEFNNILVGIESLDKKTKLEITEKIANTLCSKLNAGQGAFYKTNFDKKEVELISSYAFVKKENQILSYALGEGLIGLAAKENKLIKLDNLPHGYLNVFSGLGSTSPVYLYIFPFGEKDSAALGIIELALFKDLTAVDMLLIERAKQSFLKIFSN